MEILVAAYFIIGGGVAGLYLRRSRDAGDFVEWEPVAMAMLLPVVWLLWPLLLGSKKVIPWGN